MALVHELLYGSSDLANIELAEYLRTLVGRLVASYATTDVAYEVNADPIQLHIDTSIPCGLIVNELVSNSLKHAFVGKRRGNIEVSFRRNREGLFVLAVRDDGVGIRDPRRLERKLGLTIVDALTDQLRGSLELDTDGGTTFRVVFPPPGDPSGPWDERG
jgi:two-component sensor histidine kinase